MTFFSIYMLPFYPNPYPPLENLPEMVIILFSLCNSVAMATMTKVDLSSFMAESHRAHTFSLLCSLPPLIVGASLSSFQGMKLAWIANILYENLFGLVACSCGMGHNGYLNVWGLGQCVHRCEGVNWAQEVGGAIVWLKCLASGGLGCLRIFLF